MRVIPDYSIRSGIAVEKYNEKVGDIRMSESVGESQELGGFSDYPSGRDGLVEILSFV